MEKDLHQTTYDYFKQEKEKVKLTSETLPKLKVETIDAKIKNRRIEDTEYLVDHQLRSLLRRGNTLVRWVEGPNKGQVKIARKGLAKFFDVRLGHIKLAAGTITEADLRKEGLDCRLEYDVSVLPCVEALRKGHSIEVFQTEKANGENAQVSFVAELDAWVVCSKNVSILAKSATDIDLMASERFEYARKIAHTWFDMLKGVKDIDALKQLLAGHTAVGEYCGNINLQHMVKYDKETILFYGLVRKDSSDLCVPVEKAFAEMQVVGLPTVGYSKQAVCESVDELVKSLQELFLKTARAAMESTGEGSVLYMVQTDKDTNEQTTVALGKLKTLEYRLYRKLREKMKNMVLRKWSVEDTVKKFMKELKPLFEELDDLYETEAPKYKQLALAMSDVITKSGLVGEGIHNRYIDIIHITQACIAEKREISTEEIESLKKKKIAAVKPASDDEEEAQEQPANPQADTMEEN